MANDRIIVRCKCGEDYGICIAKGNCGIFNATNKLSDIRIQDVLQEYYEKHEDCWFETENGGITIERFELIYD